MEPQRAQRYVHRLQEAEGEVGSTAEEGTMWLGTAEEAWRASRWAQ